MAPTAPAAPAPRYAGTRVQRVEDGRLLTGRGSFVDDISRPGMLHACFVRSPFARARIDGIDASAALALPGVRAVFTAADLNPDVKEAWHAVAGKDIPDTPRPPLAEELMLLGPRFASGVTLRSGWCATQYLRSAAFMGRSSAPSLYATWLISAT